MDENSIIAQVQKLLKSGNAEQAAKVILASLNQLSQNPRALFSILEEFERQRADDILSELLIKLEQPFECLILQMRVTYRAKDYVSTLRHIEKVLATSPNHVEALRTGGRIGNVTRDDDLALRYWERLARAAPTDPEAPLQVARIEVRRHRYAEALDWAEHTCKLQPDSAEAFRIAVAAGLETGWPEKCDLFLARLFALDRTRATRAFSRLLKELECEAAARLLSTLKKKLGNDQTLTENIAKAYSEWLVAGFEHELASRELAAAAFYRAALSVQPGDRDAERGLDRLSLPSILAMREAFNNRDFAGALGHGELAARIKPNDFEAWQTIGRCQFSRNNVAQARDAFRRCTELKPNDAYSWLTYGLSLNQAGERSAALTAFQKASNLADPEVKREAEAGIAALHPLLVRDAHQAAAERNIERAWESSTAALVIRPNDRATAQFQRSLLRELREQIRQEWDTGSAKVADLCRQYLKKAPEDGYVLTVFGRTLMKMRSYAEALPVWETLSKQTPDVGHIHLQLARCCRSLKIRDRGIIEAQAALRLDPQLQEAAELVNFLRGLAA